MEDLKLFFKCNEYLAGGIYIECDIEDEPYADISVWTDLSPLLKYSNEIVVPTYKLSKEFLDKVEKYGFLKINYDRPVRIGYGTGHIGELIENYQEKIKEINNGY